MPFSMSHDAPRPVPARIAIPGTVSARVRRHIPMLRDSPPAPEAKADLAPRMDAVVPREGGMDTPDDGAALLARAEVEGGLVGTQDIAV